MIQALEVLRLQKGMSRDCVGNKQNYEIQPVAIFIIELHLS